MIVKILHSTNPVFPRALEEITEKLPSKEADFAFIAISPTYNYKDVPFFIEKILKVKKYLAFNAVDSFNNTQVISNGVTACFIWFEHSAEVKIFNFPNLERRLKDKKFAEKIASILSSDNLNMIIADYTKGIFPLFFKKVSTFLERENINASNICGGIVSTFVDNERQPGYIFSEGRIFENCFSIVQLKGVKFELGLSTGIFKRGPIYQITSGKGFFIYELDGKPAGFLPKALLKHIERKKKEYLWYTPLAILNEKGELLALRTFKSFTNRYIEVWAPIEQGQKVKLAVVIPEEILRDTEEVAKNVKEKLGTAELAINFSCTARQYTLENRAGEEVEIYAKVLNAPIFGYFTHGEIALGMDKRKLKLHNQTSVIVAIREEKDEGSGKV